MQTINNTHLDRLLQTSITKTKVHSLKTNGRQTTPNNEVVHDGHLMTIYTWPSIIHFPDTPL